ncbi:MAG: hypothetical protein HYZ58_19785 [Acidobacteria bacterium]|nr:hypothetical protein [Acidobacteriota bacterium]
MAEQTVRAGAASEREVGRFTVGVFQDVPWAERGLEALKRQGFPSESISILAKAGPDQSALVERALGGSATSLDVKPLGPVVARGPLLAALQGRACDLAQIGLADAMRRVGFQGHDGLIFETLTGRGGILVAIMTEPRAADALATLHCYGGGNAAIGAWLGRV